MLDAVYEAAAVPELWPSVLDRLSTITDGVGGLLFATNANEARWTASGSLATVFDRFIRDGLMDRNPRPRRLAAMRYAGFVSDLDVFTPDEIEQDPVYRHFREIGLGWAAGTMFPMPSGDLLVFSFERAFDRGPIERDVILRFDRLRPHLARAGLLAWRLGLRKARVMAQALEVVGLPAAVLSDSGRLVALNPSFERLMPRVIQDRRDRLVLASAQADALLLQALERLRGGMVRSTTSSIPLPARDGQPPIVVHLLPVKGAAHDVFAQGKTIMLVTPVDRAKVATAEVLEGLFDLTPAEARVARAIAEGDAIADIAPSLGVAEGTVRTQLKAVLAKTGLHRQAELVALLAGSAPSHLHE
ncbi:MAG: helix-turn-helix transcriptional regulator [Rhizobiales bacterium]|nr:helix-turn-helix transcriptional regulator [Hyphomicrobiales bacterium]